MKLDLQLEEILDGVHIAQVKPMLPAENVVNQLPDYSTFGRKATLRLNPDNILDLKWSLATQLNTMPTTTTSKDTSPTIKMLETSINLNNPISTPYKKT